MKTCPLCDSRYSDNTLRFCLQDGAPLVDEADSQSGTPTDSFDEPETVISKVRGTETASIAGTGADASTPAPPSPEARRPGTLTAVFLTVFVMLVIFGLASAAAYYFYFWNGSADSDNSGSGTPGDTRTEKPSCGPVRQGADASAAVRAQLENWRLLAEAGDFEGYMGCYADRLDVYFTRQGAGKDSVRRDKKRAFDNYRSIGLKITDVEAKVSENGKSAMVEFDKEWTFEPAGKGTNGKVRSQIEFTLVRGVWLITTERDLSVYYVK